MSEHSWPGELPTTDEIVTEAQVEETADTEAETSTAGTGVKKYRFTKSALDYGEIVPVAGIHTNGGFVRRGDTIDLDGDEVERLKKAGHTFVVVSDEEELND